MPKERIDAGGHGESIFVFYLLENPQHGIQCCAAWKGLIEMEHFTKVCQKKNKCRRPWAFFYFTSLRTPNVACNVVLLGRAWSAWKVYISVSKTGIDAGGHGERIFVFCLLENPQGGM